MNKITTILIIAIIITHSSTTTTDRKRHHARNRHPYLDGPVQIEQPLIDNTLQQTANEPISTEIRVSPYCVLSVTGRPVADACECTIRKIDGNQDCDSLDLMASQTIVIEQSESCEKGCHQYFQQIVNGQKRKKKVKRKLKRTTRSTNKLH